jgi:hypothetical protein
MRKTRTKGAHHAFPGGLKSRLILCCNYGVQLPLLSRQCIGGAFFHLPGMPPVRRLIESMPAKKESHNG